MRERAEGNAESCVWRVLRGCGMCAWNSRSRKEFNVLVWHIAESAQR